MADQKISQLTAATTPLAGTEVVPLVQSTTTKKVSIDNITKGRIVNALSFDTDIAAAGVTLSGTTLAADGTDADINVNVTPKGTGSVVLSKADINGGTVDGTVIGGSSAAAATVTSLTSAADNNIAISGLYVRTKSGSTVTAGVPITMFTVNLGNFSGNAVNIIAFARLFSGGGGARVFYRQSLIVETGGASLSETNLVNSQGGNGTVAFSLSGATVSVTLQSAVGAETYEICLQILSRTPGTITTL
jgi:hypothetical protein